MILKKLLMSSLESVKMSKCIAVIRRSLDLSPEDTVIPVSALKRTGQGELLDHMESILEE